MNINTLTGKQETIESTITNRLSQRFSIIEIGIPALALLFGLQVLRVLVPGVTWMLGDRFGLGAVQLGIIALVIFSLSFFAGAVKKLLGRRWSIILTAGSLGLMRVLMQIQWSEPLVNLCLAMLGTVFFGLFMPIYLDELRLRGKYPVYNFAVGLLAGLILDTAIHGAFGTYDTAWQSGVIPLLVTALLAIFLWLLLIYFYTRSDEQGSSLFSGTDRRTWQWLAIGPFLFLQLVIHQNIARLAALTGWILPFSFGWILLSQVIALFAVIWLLRRGWQKSRLVVLIASAILIAVAACLYPQEQWLQALSVLVGQISLSVLLIIFVGTIGVQNPGKPFSSTTVANGLGMILLVIFLFGYYAVYQIKLPYDSSILEIVAAVVVSLCALSSLVVARERVSFQKFSWIAPVIALLLLFLPLAAILIWQEVEEKTGDGFPVRIMTYNLHNGFNTDGYLDIEALAQVIDENNPDIIALQEVSRGWLVSGRLDMLTWLSQRLNMQYVYGPTADPLWGNAIISKHPIVNYSNSELPPRDLFILRGFIPATIDIGNSESLNIIATHFHHLDEDSDVRQLQVPVIVDSWGGAEKTIILGDLNAEPDTPEMDMLREAGLIDSMEALESSEGFTFHSANPVRRIDYIWVSPDLDIKEMDIPLSQASDHLPVVVIIDR
jgi:endonuclease/exonuclease/phosphatase family metal-dependent hydrolase